MIEYLTEQNSVSLNSLTDPCSGNEKLCISLYLEFDLLGKTEIGEILNVEKGEVKRFGYSSQFYFFVNLIFSNDGFHPNNLLLDLFQKADVERCTEN